MWDRVPVKGALPARDDGLADPEEAPLVVHSSYVQFPFKPPMAHVLHPPMVNLNVSLPVFLVVRWLAGWPGWPYFPFWRVRRTAAEVGWLNQKRRFYGGGGVVGW